MNELLLDDNNGSEEDRNDDPIQEDPSQDSNSNNEEDDDEENSDDPVSGMITFLRTMAKRLCQDQLELIEKTRVEMLAEPTIMNPRPVLSSHVIETRDELKLRDFIRKMFIYGVMGLPFQSSLNAEDDEFRFTATQRSAYVYCVQQFFEHYFPPTNAAAASKDETTTVVVKTTSSDGDDDGGDETGLLVNGDGGKATNHGGGADHQEKNDDDIVEQRGDVTVGASDEQKNARNDKDDDKGNGGKGNERDGNLKRHWTRDLFDGDYELQAHFIAGPLANILVDMQYGHQLIDYLLQCLELDAMVGDRITDVYDDYNDEIYRFKCVVIDYLDNGLMYNWTDEEHVDNELVTLEEYNDRVKFLTQSASKRIYTVISQRYLSRNKYTMRFVHVPILEHRMSLRNRAIELLDTMGLCAPATTMADFEFVLDQYSTMDQFALENQLLLMMTMDRDNSPLLHVDSNLQKLAVMINDDSLPVICREACCTLLRARKIFLLYGVKEHARSIIHRILDFYVREDSTWSLRNAAAIWLEEQIDSYEFSNIEQDIPALYDKLCQVPFQALEVIKKLVHTVDTTAHHCLGDQPGQSCRSLLPNAAGDVSSNDNDRLGSAFHDPPHFNALRETLTIILLIAAKKYRNEPSEALEWIDSVLCDCMNHVLGANRGAFISGIVDPLLDADFLFLRNNPPKLKSFKLLIDHVMGMLSEEDMDKRIELKTAHENAMCILLRLLKHTSGVASYIIHHPKYKLVQLIEKTTNHPYLCVHSLAMRTTLHRRGLSPVTSPNMSLLDYAIWMLRVAVSFIVQQSSGDMVADAMESAIVLLRLNTFSTRESLMLLYSVKFRYWVRLASSFYQLFRGFPDRPLYLSFYMELCHLENHPQSVLSNCFHSTYSHFHFLDSEDQYRAITIFMNLVATWSNLSNKYRECFLLHFHIWNDFLVKRVRKLTKHGQSMDCQLLSAELRCFRALWC